MRNVILILMTLLMAACAQPGGGGSSGGSSPAATKDLFSKWTAVNDPNTYIDMTGRSFGVLGGFTWTFTNGSVCQAELFVSGTEAMGTGAISSSIYIAGGIGTDPGCAGLDGPHTYVKTDTNLTICNQANQCQTYE